MTQFQQAAREALEGIARRATMRCWSVAPGSICAPWSTTSPSRAATPRWPPRWRRSSTRAGPPRRTCTPASPRSIRWRGADGADQPPPGRPRPGGHPRLGPSLLDVRSRARGVPGARHGAGRPVPADRGDRRPHRLPLRPHGRGRPGRRGAGAGRPPGGHLPHGAPGAGLPRGPGPRGGGAPLADCVEEAVRHTRQFARRQASWFRRDPRVRWAGSAAEAQALLAEALAVHG